MKKNRLPPAYRLGKRGKRHPNWPERKSSEKGLAHNEPPALPLKKNGPGTDPGLQRHERGLGFDGDPPEKIGDGAADDSLARTQRSPSEKVPRTGLSRRAEEGPFVPKVGGVVWGERTCKEKLHGSTQTSRSQTGKGEENREAEASNPGH